MKNHNETFGKVLRHLRTERGLSQENLAFDANLDRTYISLLEIGRHSPSLDSIFAICDALNVKFSDIAALMEADAE